MRVTKVEIKNFRLLADAEMALEEDTTLVVGRNNSGKTSFAEAIKRFLIDKTAKFQLHDFSNSTYSDFIEAHSIWSEDDETRLDEIRACIPTIELCLTISYDANSPDYGPLGKFIVELDSNCNEALIIASYQLKEGALDDFFGDTPKRELTSQETIELFNKLKTNIPALYQTKLRSEDPNDPENSKELTPNALRSIVNVDIINAQRGLDDDTVGSSDVLAKILEGLFISAKSPTAESGDQTIANALQDIVSSIQDSINADFKEELSKLMPTFGDFGYPGLGGSEIETETVLDVERLLSNHTKVNYAGHHGVPLPESYSGLGIRNLVFILLQIVSSYRRYRADQSPPGIQLICIEEPEAHLHPQMQEVFIKQVSSIATKLCEDEDEDIAEWPVQFIVSTHSSHIANACGFEAIRYFLPDTKDDSTRMTDIKDLRVGMAATHTNDKDFLRQYLTLTKCDLFFADKAILIEGTGERLLLPIFIEKTDEELDEDCKLSTQYLTVMEVGGAYAHKFHRLLEFLQLRSLIITDLDSTLTLGGKACAFHDGVATSNACIKHWFDDNQISPNELISKSEDEKTKLLVRICYQVPDSESGECGRTLEDAFMLANKMKFEIEADSAEQAEDEAWTKLSNIKKSEFALHHAIEDTDWVTPRYIREGLKWLAELDVVAIGNPAQEVAPEEE